MKTPLTQEAYETLAQAVGVRNIDDDDSTVACYGWNALGADPGPNKLSLVWPSAVVLPGSTEEVQAVVKACNRYSIRFRATSSGILCNSTTAGHYIIIDLRRMNGIEIDARNQMAVIQPYATAGQLQAEAMQQGLTCHLVGAGPQHSPLASATAFHGMGISGATTGINFRNLLSFEWVTPQGEVLRVGSAGANAGWFSGEGPGPGFRGMIRGDVGTMGGLGVFTRIGYKLHPWQGPREVGKTGVFPQLGMRIPEHFKLYHIAWDNWEGPAEAALEFNNSRVADYWLRMPPGVLGWLLTASNNEFVERFQAANLPEATREENGKGWTVLTAANSAAEARFKEKVMAHIIAKTKGRVVELAPEHAEIMTRNLVTSCYVLRVFRPALGGLSTFGVLDSFRLLPQVMKTAEAATADDIKRGHFSSVDKENVWSWGNEGRYLWSENVPIYSSADKRAAGAAVRYYLRLMDRLSKSPLGINGFASGPAADLAGPKLGHANEWMRKVKNTFDPQNLSIPQFYISPERGIEAKAWPIASKVLLSRWGAPLFKFVTDRMFTHGKN